MSVHENGDKNKKNNGRAFGLDYDLSPNQILNF